MAPHGVEEVERAKGESLIWMHKKTNRVRTSLQKMQDTGIMLREPVANSLIHSLEAAIDDYEITIGTLINITRDIELKKELLHELQEQTMIPYFALRRLYYLDGKRSPNTLVKSGKMRARIYRRIKLLDRIVDARIQIVREAEKLEETRSILSNIKKNLVELKEIQELSSTETQKISDFITSADLEHTDDIRL